MEDANKSNVLVDKLTIGSDLGVDARSTVAALRTRVRHDANQVRVRVVQDQRTATVANTEILLQRASANLLVAMVIAAVLADTIRIVVDVDFERPHLFGQLAVALNTPSGHVGIASLFNVAVVGFDGMHKLVEDERTSQLYDGNIVGQVLVVVARTNVHAGNGQRFSQIRLVNHTGVDLHVFGFVQAMTCSENSSFV